MKNIIIVLAIGLTTLSIAACNNNSKKTTAQAGNDTTAAAAATTTEPNSSKSGVDAKTSASVKEMVANYLQLKNALTTDNTNDAATAGKALSEGFVKLDKSVLTADQKKAYTDIADDAKEMAEHIGISGGKLPHQREHFDMLSKDMYDLVKLFGAGMPLYVDRCPMFNDKKGAIWLSETKEIKNPYLGSSMPTCGSIKEELK
ncbi:DUF3347 domain-containing protein [Mucilaginibacter rubeus]|uniref:DUF3347 domain-containing protein n=2 Tax=Mucilaginibacter rubeus TaxID=2027860 RepID=A0A364WR71_9SPHI|nr:MULTISPECIES: DUF3347 domain-containing protein [Mucilaginibacter]QEM06133.1 DUF3347 domain-containing protein [Mucilaginibacter rubeus]QEM13650.1 DUF3347 domain-containing protein [Mucilaginibacter rubeus]QEM18713.1 DUF3347 domain-containing protein [Mucilaginibacter gossypii]QTE36293.1 DUF3347 domain-containing protein [Mucilaginibacter gossypii]QTE44746.1 DUF3347 domain-containing protein [Mucilaginibacter rubeus]